MLFSRQITVLFVTRGKIRSDVFSSRGKAAQEVKTYDWTEENLQSVLKEIASHVPNRVRVVFGEEFSYVIALKTSQSTREGILEEAQAVIPDELENNWDFQKGDDPDFPLQVAAVNHNLFNIFSSSLLEAGFFIEAVEPQSISLARIFPRKGLFLFFARDEKVLLGAIKNGVVIATHVTNPERAVPILGAFLTGVRNKCNAQPEKIFVSKGINADSDIFSKNNIQAESLNLNPLYGAAMKKDISGKDSFSLNIKSKRPDSSDKKIKQPRRTVSRREKILIILFCSIILIGIILAAVLKLHS
jgi:hypothetical protein